jgi:hypothetical protein
MALGGIKQFPISRRMNRLGCLCNVNLLLLKASGFTRGRLARCGRSIGADERSMIIAQAQVQNTLNTHDHDLSFGFKSAYSGICDR